ncbi:AEC family transporter [Rhodovastum atsumiense]|nr:AEC family transporter [Rhodovastum atsumiense]CAH2601571.1 AEC family transporter [Rhodovastum atsumiense]
MSILFGIVAPVFILIGLGAASLRLRIVDAAAMRGMTDFVFYIAFPALLFGSVAEAPPLRLADVAGSFLVGAAILFFLALLLGRLVLKVSLAQASVFGMNSIFGNTVMVGIPIVSAAYGRDGLVTLMAIIAFHSVVLIPLATIFIEADRGGRGSILIMLRSTFTGIIRNPIVMSLVFAFAWRLVGVPMPAALHRVLDLLAAAGPPLALFCLGGTLPRPSWSDLREVSLAVLLKLVAMPAIVAVVAHLVGVTGLAFAVTVLTAALPTGANAFLLARRFETMMEASASTVVIATALSMVTLTLLLGWLPR